jgi:hypothetical protein
MTKLISLFAALILSDAVCAQTNPAKILFPFVEEDRLLVLDYSGKTVRGPFLLAKQEIYSSTWSADQNSGVYGPTMGELNDQLIFTDSKKYGLVDKYGEVLLKAEYDSIATWFFTPDVNVIVMQAGKYGIPRKDGSWFIPPRYEEISTIVSENATVKYISFRIDSLWGLMDLSGKIILQPAYTEIYTWNGFYALKNPEGYQFCDSMFRKLNVHPVDEILDFHSDGCVVRVNNKFGLLAKNGKWLIEAKLENKPLAFENGFYKIEKNYQSGLLDSAGKEIIPLKYDKIEFDNGYFVVSLQGKKGIYSPGGKLLVPLTCEEVKTGDPERDPGLFIFTQKNKYGAYTTSGKLIIQPLYTYLGIGHSHSGKLEFENAGKSGIMDISGKIIEPAKYDWVSSVDSASFIYGLKGKAGIKYYSPKKNPLKQEFDSLVRVSDLPSFAALKNNKWGLIDESGKVILDFIYDKIDWYSTVFTLVSQDESGQIKTVAGTDTTFGKNVVEIILQGKEGIANSSGKIVVAPEYDEIEPFRNGVARAKKDGRTVLLKADGTRITAPGADGSDELSFFEERFFLLNRKGKFGLLDGNLNLIIPPVYDGLYETGSADFFGFDSGGKKGIISAGGKILIPAVCPIAVGYENKMGIVKDRAEVIAYVDSTGKFLRKKKVVSLQFQNIGRVPDTYCMYDDLEEFVNIGNDWDYNFSLPSCFYSLPKLKKLVFLNSELDSIPPAIANLKTLRYLAFSSYKITKLPKEVALLALLDTLMTGGNSLELPGELSALKNLKYLETSCNRIPAFESLVSVKLYCDSLPDGISRLKNLRLLSVYFKYGDRSIPQPPVNVFRDLSTLTELEELIITGSFSIPPEQLAQNIASLCNLKKLKTVNLPYLDEATLQELQVVLPGVNFVSTN